MNIEDKDEAASDEDLTDLLQTFMGRLRLYLNAGGDEAVIDRILGAATVGAAALLILWPKDRSGGLIGITTRLVEAIWEKRKWIGMP